MTESPLPGATAFFAFLKERCPTATIAVTGPVVGDWSYGMEYAKAWTITVDGQKIGEYWTFGPKPDEDQPGLEYRGLIPGYINEMISDGDHSQVSLIFGNQRFEAASYYENMGGGQIVETPWQRQDGHDTIPFP